MNRRFLVFTSAGDRNSISHWLGSDRNFDIYVCYYGNAPETLSCQDEVEYFVCRKGGKFPNLKSEYQSNSSVFDQYEAILVSDDDVVINCNDISRCFDVLVDNNLWLMQPSFLSSGKISFFSTLKKPGSELRYTNFIEMTCPIFKTEKLKVFLDEFDEKVFGWGADIWFCHILIGSVEDKCAISDLYSCINPHDEAKIGGGREINLLEVSKTKDRIWREVAREKGIPHKAPKRKIYRTVSIREKQSYLVLFRDFLNYYVYYFKYLTTKVKNKFRHLASSF